MSTHQPGFELDFNPRRTQFLGLLGLVLVAALLIGVAVAIDYPLAVGLVLVGPVGLLLLVVLRRILRSPLNALYLILCLVPFHTITMNLLRLRTSLPVSILDLISIWKEGALLLVLAVVTGGLLYKHRKLPRTVLIPLYFSLVALAAVFILLAPTLSVGFYQFRNLFIGLPILLALYLLRPRLDNFVNFIDVVVVEGLLFSAIAFYQVYLSDFYTFLIRFGFVDASKTYHEVRYGDIFNTSWQLFWRANSIFVGPNEFGLFMACLIVLVGSLLFFGREYLGRRRARLYILALPILLAGEFMTISRNSWIFIAVAGFVLSLKLKRRYQLQLAVTVVVMAIALLAFVSPFRSFVVNTLTLRDSSAAGRVSEVDDILAKILEAPLGRGLGEASYKIRRFGFQEIHTEYFVFMVALELGIPGLLWYLFIISQFGLACFRRGGRSPGIKKALCWGASALVFGTMASQFFAIISLDWLFQMYLWFFVGSALWGTTSQLSKLKYYGFMPPADDKI